MKKSEGNGALEVVTKLFAVSAFNHTPMPDPSWWLARLWMAGYKVVPLESKDLEDVRGL